jgi:hypothetical protein
MADTPDQTDDEPATDAPHSPRRHPRRRFAISAVAGGGVLPGTVSEPSGHEALRG